MFRFSLLGLGAFFLTLSVSQVEGADAHHLRFLMAHKPDNSENVELINNFSQRVKARTKGRVQIEPIMPGPNTFDPHSYALQNIYVGEMEMGQISVKKFRNFNTVIEVLDAPLVFKSHEHAARVLDGEIGASLRQNVAMTSNGRIQGLSFTYSGGFRNLYSTDELNSIKDLDSKLMRVPGGRFSRDLMAELGLKMTIQPPHNREWVEAMAAKKLQVEEAETIRIASYEKRYPKVAKSVKSVLRTEHSLFLTMVAINGDTLKALSKEDQAILQEEAQVLAVQERELSIDQEKRAEAKFKAQGVRFVELSKEDRKLLGEAAAKVREMHQETFGKWFDAIKRAEHKPAVASK